MNDKEHEDANLKSHRRYARLLFALHFLLDTTNFNRGTVQNTVARGVTFHIVKCFLETLLASHSQNRGIATQWVIYFWPFL